MSKNTSEAIGQIVREYLLKNPEVLQEAFTALRQRMRKSQRAAQASAPQTEQDKIFHAPHDYVVGNPLYLHKAADAIKSETKGRVELGLYSNNQFGGDPAMFSQLRTGALESFLLSGVNALSSLIPKSSIYGSASSGRTAIRSTKRFTAISATPSGSRSAMRAWR